MRALITFTILSATIAGIAIADPASPLRGRAARKLMYPPATAQARIIPQSFLSDDDLALIAQVAATQPYYGAVALSPSEGLRSRATLAAANFHDLENARAAALAGCNETKKEVSQDCVIVAEILPEGYAPRALSLSSDATAALTGIYRKGFGRKALAISPSTGKWAVAKGAGASAAAVADCTAKAAAGDCVVAVEN